MKSRRREAIDEGTLFSLVHDLIRRKKPGEAVELLKFGLKKFPKNHLNLCTLGDLYYDAGNLGRAEKCYARGAQTFNQDPVFHVKLGNIQLERNEFQKAAFSLLQGRRKCQKSIGILGSLQHAFQLSLQSYTTPLFLRFVKKMMPTDVETMEVMADVLAQNGHALRAKTDLVEAICTFPTPILKKSNQDIVASYVEMLGEVNKLCPGNRGFAVYAL